MQIHTLQYIVMGVVSEGPEKVLPWTNEEGRFLTGIGIRTPDQISVAELRELFESGRAQVLGEISVQYAGIPIDDVSLDPLFALARELDLPVHVLGNGGSPDFPSQLGNPLRLVPVLRKHPGLRVWVENSGWPFLEEVTALMYQYPTVYGDVSTILSHRPRDVALKYVKGLIENGLGKRIMFGSDQMIWPEVIDVAVDAIQSAEFLTREQASRIFSPYQLSELPQASISYSNARRDSLDRAIREWDATMNCKSNTGVLDEIQ